MNTNTVEYKDPINGRTIKVQSVYRPARTLLEGAPYSREPTILVGEHYLRKEVKVLDVVDAVEVRTPGRDDAP